MSTANFVTVALTVTGRWAKAGEGERERMVVCLDLRGREEEEKAAAELSLF